MTGVPKRFDDGWVVVSSIQLSIHWFTAVSSPPLRPWCPQPSILTTRMDNRPVIVLYVTVATHYQSTDPARCLYRQTIYYLRPFCRSKYHKIRMNRFELNWRSTGTNRGENGTVIGWIELYVAKVLLSTPSQTMSPFYWWSKHEIKLSRKKSIESTSGDGIS